MHDATRGELNSPGAGELKWSGAGRCRNPRRVALAGSMLRHWSGEVGRRPNETLRCGRVRRVIVRAGQARERRLGEVRVKVFAVKTLEGKNPREAPVVVGLNTCTITRCSCEA
jgi:hypothetical protein